MSAPHDGLSLVEETSLSQLRQRLQRDINCLSDQDRSTRRRALTKLQQVFFQESKQPEPVLRGFLNRHLADRLVAMLADPVEKCREMAGCLLLQFVQATEDDPTDSAALARKVFSMAEARVGVIPLVESAEEIRALLLRLCCAIVSKNSAEAFGREVGSEACAILAAALTDTFPDAKRECCSLLLRMARVCPGELRSRMGKVLRPLMANLGHQHSKTRQMTLQALGAILLCGSDSMDKELREVIVPKLRNLLYDRTAAVRRELAEVLAALIEAGIAREGVPRTTEASGCAGGGGGCRTAYLEPFRADLMSLLMSLLADESDGVSAEAGRLLDAVGERWGRSHAEEVAAKLADEGGGKPVSGVGSRGTGSNGSGGSVAARALCASLLPRMMPAVIDDASHWTARGRRRAVWLMCFIVRYAGEDVTPYLPQLLGSLGEASRDDEAEVREAVDECAAAVGCAVVQLSAVTDVLLPVLRGEVSGQNTPQHVTQALAVLRPVISAAASARPDTFASLVGSICGALCGDGILGASPAADEELWDASLEACRAVVESGMGDELRRPEIRLDLLRVLLWLLAGCEGSCRGGDAGSSGEADLKGEVMEVAAKLAQENGCQDAQELLGRHFPELLDSVVGPGLAITETQQVSGYGGKAEVIVRGWEKGSSRRLGFEALLRSAPRAVNGHLAGVMPIFRGLLHDGNMQAELRLTMLALLECVVKRPELTEEALRPYVRSLLTEMVVPNAVWRAGMVAATVRKVAIAVLYTALRGKKIGVEAVYSTAEQVLPVLKTTLEDHEATTRHMTCLSLQMMLAMIPGALGEEPVRILYPELLKRLDDSSDIVRRSACEALSAFFKATSPQNIRGTTLRYSMEQLLVHMDDQDLQMQEAVFEVTKVLASIEPEVAGKLAAEARSSHRSTDYCDRLVAFAATC